MPSIQDPGIERPGIGVLVLYLYENRDSRDREQREIPGLVLKYLAGTGYYILVLLNQSEQE